MATANITQRYCTSKKLHEARELLISGALTMLQHKQTTCATELSRMLLNLYNEEHTKCTQESLAPILNIANAFPPGDPGKLTFLKSAVQWSIREGDDAQGEPKVFTQLAKTYVEMNDYSQAQKYYIKGDSPQECADMLERRIKDGYASEADLFIARAVLQYLSLANLRDANILFAAITKNVNTNTPLINYVRFLLLTLERNAYPLFELLRKKYQPSLSRDPSFSQYLDHIAQVFYKVKTATSNPAPGGFGNFFSDMLKSLLTPGIEEPESEEID